MKKRSGDCEKYMQNKKFKMFDTWYWGEIMSAGRVEYVSTQRLIDLSKKSKWDRDNEYIM